MIIAVQSLIFASPCDRMSSRLEEDVDGTVIKTPSKPIVDTPETGKPNTHIIIKLG